MASDIKAWDYTDDLGNVYTRGVAAYVAAQDDGTHTLIGGVQTAALQQEPFPTNLKPRVVKCINVANGKRREVVVMRISDSPLWAGTTSVINLDDGAGVSHAYTVYSRRGERRRVRAPGL